MILATLALYSMLHGGGTAPEAGELRTYDLQALLVPYRPDSEFQVLPVRGTPGGLEEREHFDAGLVIELVRSLCAPEFEYEGRSLLEHDGSLFVTAPPAVQEKVAKIVGFLGNALGARTELVVDELLLPDALPRDPAPILAPEEAQKLLASGAQHRSWRIALRPGWAGSAVSQRLIRFVSDWNVEIAQGAAIHDPVIETVPIGDAIVCSGAAGPGGLWLALLARGAESSGAKDHPLDFYASVATETSPVGNPQPGSPNSRASGRTLQAGPRLWQSVPLSMSALALNTFLPDGKVLCVATTLGLPDQHGTRLLFVRRANAPGAPVQGLALDPKAPGGRDLVLIDAGWLRPPFCTSEGDLRAGGALPTSRDENQGGLQFQLHGADTGRAHELLPESNVCDVFDSQAWLVIARTQRTQEGGGVEAAVTRMGSGAPVPASCSAELVLRKGTTVLVRSTLALRMGISSTIVAGSEDELLDDWDVEVAQTASAADPIIRASFEGLCARMRVDKDGAGALILDVRAFGQVRSGELRNLDPQVPSVGTMSVGNWDRLGVEDRVTLPALAPQKALFGDSGGAGLVLEVTLGEQR
ncbi:MAG: hypothetical protein IPJ19_10855 [Planctomycetes bacterium]|nr:hypothetical protein [Planctomycetota bacterium]